MTTEKIFVPPIKIQGIKTKLVTLIKKNVIVNDDTLWIEPFMGSGVVGFNVEPKRAIFADINPYLIEFYQAVKLEEITPIVVRNFLEENGAMLKRNGESFYYEIRERFNAEHSPLDFLFLNRSCFNGMIRFNKEYKFNVPYGHKAERFSKAYITKIVNQIAHISRCLRNYDWNFYCQSFSSSIAMSDENSFIYCDPPYIGRHVDYYDSWDEIKENELHNELVASKSKFMLSTWDHNDYRTNSYIDTIWSSCHKLTKEHFYHVGAREINRNPMLEALLTNYEPTGRQNSITSQFEQTSFAFLS